MHGFTADLRRGARRLAATPLFTIFAVMSLAIGVGVTTAVYSIIDSIFLKDLGVADPSQVAFVVTPYEGRLLQGSISEPDFHDLRAAQTSFSRISASVSFKPALASPSVTEFIAGEAVDGAYFSTFGVTAAMGRTLEPADDADDRRVVVLSHALWRTRFAADPAIVGQSIRIAGHAFEVIGVVGPSFAGALGPFFGGTRLWIPLAAEARLATPSTEPPRQRRRLLVFGRLAPRVTAASASAELGVIARGLDATYPPGGNVNRIVPSQRLWRAKPLAALVEDDSIIRKFGLTLIGIVALVLVVACTNLSNLLLARATTRQRDLAVRRAMGASRWRLIREQCAESLILSLAGTAAAYLVFQTLRVFMTVEFNLMLPMGGSTALAIQPALDLTAVAVAGTSLLLSLLVFGLEPAWQLTRSLDLRGALAVAAGGGTPGTGRHKTLLRWQVAISAGFFIIATMFVQYTIAEARHESGVDVERIGVAVLNFRTQPWDAVRIKRTLDRLTDEAGRDASIESMSLSTALPFGLGQTTRVTLSLPGQKATSLAAFGMGASPSVFKTIGVPILRGRGFDERDDAGAAPVVIVSAFTARQVFGTVDAVGRQLEVQGQRPRPTLATVIGVAGDTDVGRLMFEDRAFVYRPLAQHGDAVRAVVVRSATHGAAVQALRAALRRADPDLAVEVIGTGRAILSGPYEFLRAAGMTAIGLGALTLALAMVGLFGIQSHAVVHRTREIGVRMSFGASAAHIRSMVLRDGCRPVLEGMAIGLVFGVAGRVIVRAQLGPDGADMSVVDPWMLLVVPIPLILSGLCACYFPAQKAAGVDPIIALRHD